MRFHVAYDQHGRILAAAEQDADQPAEMPGVTIAELDVPEEFENTDPIEFLHLLRVDVRERRLVRGFGGSST
jgi:hypothetical protein